MNFEESSKKEGGGWGRETYLFFSLGLLSLSKFTNGCKVIIASTHHSHNWHSHECLSIAMPPLASIKHHMCEQTLTLLSFPRLCWLSETISYQTCGIEYIYFFINVSRSNIKIHIWSILCDKCRFIPLETYTVSSQLTILTHFQWRGTVRCFTHSLPWMGQLWEWGIKSRARFHYG